VISFILALRDVVQWISYCIEDEVMMTLREIEREIHALSLQEKAKIVQSLFHELTGTWPGIEKTPGVMGGDACIVRTRIPVWALEGYRRLGWSEDEILENFPTLRSADLIQAWIYVTANPEEIETALREQKEG
jgi:uncharacterized protein (DUF433 family)